MAYIYMFFIANTNEEDYFKITMTGRKEMFYLTTHSTHFIYGYMVRHMV